MRSFVAIILVITLVLGLTVCSQALTLTDDPVTVVPVCMIIAQVCKSNGMDYWETFWTITAISVVKEIADQAGGNTFDSGHIGQNLAGMTFSWFLFSF